MRFLVDNQLPAALARFLSARGVDCQHVLDVGLAKATDREILAHAGREGLVIITKDEDFLHLAHAPGSAARVIWVRIGNCRRRELLAAMERTWPRIVAALQDGERIIEVR